MQVANILNNPTDGEVVLVLLTLIFGALLLGLLLIWIDRKFTNYDDK